MTRKHQTKPTQLRGKALKKRIAEAVREHVAASGGRTNLKRVAMLDVARRVPCSPTTLHKYEREEGLVSLVLADLKIRLRTKGGQAQVEALNDQISLLKKRIDELKSEKEALLVDRAEIFDRLLMASAPVSELVRADAVAASQRAGRCILCGGVSSNPISDNLISIDRDPRGRK